MRYPLAIEPEAERDLEHPYRWHEDQRAGLGGQFLACVQDVFDRIREAPEMHAVAYKTVRQTLVRRFPYVRAERPLALFGYFTFDASVAGRGEAAPTR
jgi:hypothetical protein